MSLNRWKKYWKLTPINDIQVLNKWGIEGTSQNHMKNHCKNLITDIILNGKMANTFSQNDKWEKDVPSIKYRSRGQKQ